MSEASRIRALAEAGLMHPHAEAVVAPLFAAGGFYLVAAGFERDGMTGLLDDKRGRRGPVKLTAAITEFLHAAPASASGAALAEEVAGRFGVRVHRRTVERVRRQ